eukprot:403333212
MESKQPIVQEGQAQIQQQIQPRQRTYTLQLKGLPQSATVENLQKLLLSNNLAHLSCNVQINPESKTCQTGFGSILFASRSDYTNAARKIRQLQLDGVTLDYNITPLGDYNPSTSVFIKFIPQQVKEVDLINELSQYGTILSLMILQDALTKTSRGSAYVDFSSPEEAQNVIKALDGKSLASAQGILQVRPYENIQRAQGQHHTTTFFQERQGAGPQNFQRKTNLFVNRIPYNVPDRRVHELFSQCGNIKSIMVKRPNIQQPNQPILVTGAQSIAYINYEKEEDALRAINELNGFNLEGSSITVDFYEKNKNTTSLRDARDIIGNENLKAIFIKNLDKKVTEERLKEICSKYGTILQCQLKTSEVDGIKYSRGIAEVVFSSKNEASNAIQKLYFESELGDNINVDFYKLKEGRIQEYDQRNNPLLNPFNFQPRFKKHQPYRAPQNQGMLNQQQIPQIQNVMGQQQQQPRQQQPFENAQQYQNLRPSMPQQQTQYRGARPRYPNRGNQNQQQSYQKKGQYQNYQQRPQNYQARPQQQQQFPGAQGFPPQPGMMMPMNQYGAAFQPTNMAFPAMQQQQQIPAIIPLVLVNMQEYMTKATLAEQKEYLGNLIYEFVEQRYVDEAPKITGMLLDQPPELVLQYCANRDQFYAQVDNAHNLISKAQPQ